MKIKYLQRNKVTLSLELTHLVWMLWLEYEWGSNLKPVSSNCLKINVSCCVKNFKFRTNNALFRFLGNKSKKIMLYLLQVKGFMQNVRNFNLGPKLPSLDWNLKNYWQIWNQEPRIVEMQNFRQKYKTLNLAPKIFDLAMFGIELEQTIAAFEICCLKFI